jgi:hypothetical protein
MYFLFKNMYNNNYMLNISSLNNTKIIPNGLLIKDPDTVTSSGIIARTVTIAQAIMQSFKSAEKGSNRQIFRGGEYVGELKDGVPHGRGTWTGPNGASYSGGWKDGEQHGHGTQKWENGETYEGQWDYGKRHGQGTLREGEACITGEWVDDEIFIERTSDDHLLGDFTFLKLLLARSNGCCRSFALDIMAQYLIASEFGRFQRAGLALSDAYQILLLRYELCKVDFIKAKLEKQESCFLVYGCVGHAMGLNLVPRGDFVDCEIFNSGDGLDEYHPVNRENNKYQTMVRMRVPAEHLTEGKIRTFLDENLFPTVRAAYEAISSIEGAHVLLVKPEDAIWQTGQKGVNCTLEWIFAYLKNILTHSEYHQLRIKLFEDCIVALEKNLSVPPKIKAEFIKELKRKIEKRKRKIALLNT